jgi:hypothetical protein
LVDALIFSKDRACQLDLLLRSIDRYAPGLYSSLTVLWAWSATPFAEAYQTVMKEHQGVVFQTERDFRDDVDTWLGLRDRWTRPVSFLVDDDVFYRDCDLSSYPVLPVSLRGGDYDYPFSVDGNIYRRDQLIELLRDTPYVDPSTLEMAGDMNARERWRFATNHPVEPPCLVGVPWNRVSSHSGMPHANIDTRFLNELYLEGQRLAIPSSSVNLGTHAILDLEWEISRVRV